MRPTYRSILNEKERASERQLCWSMALCWRRLSRSSSCRPAVCFNDCAMGPYVGLSSFSLSNVLGKFIVNYGTNNCWFPLARKWPTWKWTWIWILYGKIEKKCPRYFRRDSRGNPRDLNMCRTGRSAALSRGRKSMPPRRESMKLVVQQRKFT